MIKEFEERSLFGWEPPEFFLRATLSYVTFEKENDEQRKAFEPMEKNTRHDHE